MTAEEKKAYRGLYNRTLAFMKQPREPNAEEIAQEQAEAKTDLAKEIKASGIIQAVIVLAFYIGGIALIWAKLGFPVVLGVLFIIHAVDTSREILRSQKELKAK